MGHYWRWLEEVEQQEMVVADWVDDSTLANAAADQFAPLAGPKSKIKIYK